MNPNNTPYTQPGAELGLAERVRGSKALIPVIAVLTVTVLALAAFLVAGRLEAQSDARLAAQDGEIIESKQDGKAVVKPPVAIARTPVANARPASPVACSNCGTIESVTPVQHAAPTSGLGAVAGGLVGGLLGNQVGGGTGRTVATVAGAVGGGYAGNAIEKNTRKTTTYQVRVRMNDGSVRTIEQGTAATTGARVVVDGNVLRPA
ncbi:MAG: glycine zipper 2TM domain-containing protein [Pseudomonadota bacterium]